ncbi:hypothetical protein QAD02_004224 [Eretmocerus hayati]|uniref:Uncharacterized protein n=1 Tax=Eretmocerus hayati TaxID=131215 RepID=A0ACC2NQ65_9HYME|nr:hypothetical protein QAD02_004224 [Eretmocerus hayati]
MIEALAYGLRESTKFVSDGLSKIAAGSKKALAGGVTGVADGALKAKKKIGKALHDVSPNVLGPVSDALDPEWITGMNYTRFVMDMKGALDDGNTALWAKAVSKTFDVDKVIEDIKTSTATKASCLACKFIINLARHMMQSGRTDEEITSYAIDICSTLRIQHPDVCTGIMHLIGVDAIHVIRASDMRPAAMCSFFLGEGCLGGTDPRHDWNVNFPARQKPNQLHPTEIQEPPIPTRPLKVLHITDTHFDPYYQPGADNNCDLPMCCRASTGLAKNNATAAGLWGDYRKCDSPIWLIENALQHIAETHKDIDYIIWTGDLPPHDVWNQTREENINNVRISNELMKKYFKNIPIYPSVGNHESCPVDGFIPPFAPPEKNMSYLYDELDRQWSQWLPRTASRTVRYGGFYSVPVRNAPGFRIISVNGNYCSRNNFWFMLNSTDPVGQLDWLIQELHKAETRREKVHIIGHIPPGQPDCLKVWSKNYYDIVHRYEATIAAQFFGHTHYDEYELFYETQDFKRPISVGYIAPSITPWKDVNPAYRIYYVEGNHAQTTRSILDFETWTMKLDKANRDGEPVWYKSYTALAEYNMTSLLPNQWDQLIGRMKKDKDVFNTFYKNYFRDTPTMPKCNKECQRRLLCDLRSARSHDRPNLCHEL